MKNTVPKVIHYCWFGGNPMPELARKCIASWKKYCPEYQIIEWNESNFNLDVCEYVKEAYHEKKWAFVSDYARFWILYNFGGVYVDTDVEFIKSIDEIVQRGAYMGCESVLQNMNNCNSLTGIRASVNPGLGLAAPAHHPFFKEVLKHFESRSFYKLSGELDLTTIVQTTTILLEKYGFKDSNSIQKVADIIIYPVDYFCPKNLITGELNITSNTYSIHHYTTSWQSDKEKKQFEVLQKLNSVLGSKFGYKIWRGYMLPSRICNKFRRLGFKKTIKFVLKKI